MERKPVDIIIPIYNAFDDLVLCMRSIRRYTDLTKDRVIMINDCSTDERIIPFIRSQEEENIIFINNESNQGFSRNVNKGMNYSKDRDVILLNSDTMVTKNWIDKIVACAYSKPEIGTVTPLSNCATLCSVPIMCTDNPMPQNVTVDEFAALIERCSIRRYPRITVAVGFCMFIKREVIELVGLFDAETFERGYGEENDFCNRAELLGYIHVMCDDTFIYHKGTVSFKTEQKQQLMEAHAAILEEWYPYQMRKNHLYCLHNPEQYIRDNINVHLRLHNEKKNILYLLQSDFRQDAENNVGGTQFHVRDMVHQLKDKYNVFVLARVSDKLRLSIYNGDNPVDTFEFYIGERPDYPTFRDSRQYQIYETVLKAFDIQLVHVHHAAKLSFDLFYAAEALDIPIQMTLHDYYYLCPNEKLLTEDLKYCRACPSMSGCNECLSKTVKIAAKVEFLRKWRKECKAVLEKCEEIFAPSQSVKNLFVSVYPELEERINVIYHGCELGEKEEVVVSKIEEEPRMHSHFDYVMDKVDEVDMVVGWACIEGVESLNTEIYLEVTDEHKNTLYLKTMMVQREDVAKNLSDTKYEYSGFRVKVPCYRFAKGKLTMRILARHEQTWYTEKDVLRVEVDNNVDTFSKSNFHVAFLGGLVPAKGSQLAYEMIRKDKEKIDWYVIGNMDDTQLQDLKKDNFHKLGLYNRDELKDIFTTYKIDLVCILSICPETFCYTLSEALLSGIPVMVNDIGALGERVRKNDCGWIVDSNRGADDILNKIYELSDKSEMYMSKKKNAIEYDGKTTKQMTEEYIPFYEKSIREKQNLEYDTEFVFKAMK